MNAAAINQELNRYYDEQAREQELNAIRSWGRDLVHEACSVKAPQSPVDRNNGINSSAYFRGVALLAEANKKEKGTWEAGIIPFTASPSPCTQCLADPCCIEAACSDLAEYMESITQPCYCESLSHTSHEPGSCLNNAHKVNYTQGLGPVCAECYLHYPAEYRR